MGLAAWVQARRRLPFGDRLVRHPQRQAAAVPNSRVVRRPISDFEFHLPEMMPPIRVVFVRHQKETQSVSSTDQPSIASPAQTPDIAASMQQRLFTRTTDLVQKLQIARRDLVLEAA